MAERNRPKGARYALYCAVSLIAFFCYRSCGQPTSESRPCSLPAPPAVKGDLHRALVTVEYFNDTGQDPGSSIPWFMPLKDAVDEILRDRTFGSVRRQARLYTVIQMQQAAHPGDPVILALPPVPAPPPQSIDCCSSIDDCLIRSSPPGELSAAVAFKIDAPVTYDKVAPLLDPQNWDTVKNTSFRTTFYTGKDCPRSYTATPGTPQDWAKGWSGAVYELFQYRCDDPPACTLFENALSIDARHDANAHSFDLDYHLCPNGSYRSKIAGHALVCPGAILEDCGHTDATDNRPGFSTVRGSKRLQFDPRICGGNCPAWVGIGMTLSLRVLAQETSIAVCQAQGAQPAPCTGFTCTPMDDASYGQICTPTR